MLTAFIAAAVSTGRSWPDGTHAPAGDVLIVNIEDGQADTTRPRLDAAGADVAHVHAADLVRHPDGTLRCMTLADVQPIADALERMQKPRAVILDPVSAFMGAADSHVAADVRGLLAPLAELAQRSGVAFILIAHLNKSMAQSAMNRINGSGAYVAACRSAWIVVKDKDTEQRRLLLPLKNNLGPDQGGLAYRITVAENGAPRVEFESEPVNIRADDALAAPRDDEGADDPASFLRELLGDGPMAARDVRRHGDDAGFAWRTLQRVMKKAGVISKRPGFGQPALWSIGEHTVAPVAPVTPTPECGADGATGATGDGSTSFSHENESPLPAVFEL